MGLRREERRWPWGDGCGFHHVCYSSWCLGLMEASQEGMVHDASCSDGCRSVIHRRWKTWCCFYARLDALGVAMYARACRREIRDHVVWGELVAGRSSHLGWVSADSVPPAIRHDGCLRGLGSCPDSGAVWTDGQLETLRFLRTAGGMRPVGLEHPRGPLRSQCCAPRLSGGYTVDLAAGRSSPRRCRSSRLGRQRVARADQGVEAVYLVPWPSHCLLGALVLPLPLPPYRTGQPELVDARSRGLCDSLLLPRGGSPDQCASRSRDWWMTYSLYRLSYGCQSWVRLAEYEASCSCLPGFHAHAVDPLARRGWSSDVDGGGCAVVVAHREMEYDCA
jgi:hypothetical protein